MVKSKNEVIIKDENQEQIKKEYSHLGVLNRETKVVNNKLTVEIHYSRDGKLMWEDYCTEEGSILRKEYSPSGKLISEGKIRPSGFFGKLNNRCNKEIHLQ